MANLDEQGSGAPSLRKILAVASSIAGFIGIGGIILAAIGDDMILPLFDISSDSYAKSLLILFVVSMLVALIALNVWVIVFTRGRNKEIISLLAKKPKTCEQIQHELTAIQQAATHLKGVLAETEVAKSIVQGVAVDDMERSVEKGKRIYIFTSKFILEKKKDFLDVIISNFRKGVHYIYLVPDDVLAVGQYESRVTDWYKEFSVFLKSKHEALRLKSEHSMLIDSYNDANIRSSNDPDNIVLKNEAEKIKGQFWSAEYVQLIDDALVAFDRATSAKTKKLKEIKVATIKHFNELLETRKLSKSLFYVTVAMYEQDADVWLAIVKLPTENPEENFVAFSIANANIHEQTTFTNSIQNMALENQKYDLPDKIFA